MLAILSAGAAAVATLFAVLALRRSRPTAADLRLESMGGPHATGWDGSPFEAPPKGRERWGSALWRLLPSSMHKRTVGALIAAGRPATPAEFVLLVVLAGAVAGLAVALLCLAAQTGLVTALVAGFIVAAIATVGLPALWLRGRINRRRTAIWRTLPDAADLLTTCVEAGLDINASLARVALDMPGPLQEEVRIMLHEVSLGRRRRDALVDIGRRTGVSDLGGMLAAIAQAEETGTQLGAALRAQSRHIRQARRLYAEERARLVAAKMTFPIIFLIVPTLFVLLLGPVAFEVLRILS